MSVQQEHLTMKPATHSDHAEAQVEKPPKLEYSVKGADESLEAYISAISGAIIGVLATLLILYILNGGTLRFTNPAKLTAIEASLARVDENVGAVNQNVETVATRLAAMEGEAGVIGQLQTSLTDLDAALKTAMAEQGGRIDALDESVAALDVTRKNFDTFTAALASALSEMGAVSAPAAEPVNAVEAPVADAAAVEAPVVEAPVAAAVEVPVVEAPVADAATVEAPVVEAPVADAAAVDSAATELPAEAAPIVGLMSVAVAVQPDLAVDSVQVVLFTDGNSNGVMDADETALLGGIVTLTPAEGEATSMDSTESGTLFSALALGEYTVSVDELAGYELSGDTNTIISVAADAEAGQVVYFAIAAE